MTVCRLSHTCEREHPGLTPLDGVMNPESKLNWGSCGKQKAYQITGSNRYVSVHPRKSKSRVMDTVRCSLGVEGIITDLLPRRRQD